MNTLEKILSFNKTKAPFPQDMTIQQMFEQQVARTPDEIAVICDHQKWFEETSFLSYKKLNELANSLAMVLREKGVGPDHIVGIITRRSCFMQIGILAILKAGGAYLPIAPESPVERIKYMLKDSGANILLTAHFDAKDLDYKGEIIKLENAGYYNKPVVNLPAVNTPRDLAYLIYTSGSTGKPKGVMIEHRALINRLNWMQKNYPLDQADVILQKTPFYFDVSVWELFWWSWYGAKLCFLMPEAEKIPMVIVNTIEKYKITILHFVPSMLNVFLEYIESKDASYYKKLNSLKHVFCSGEALTVSHVKKFNKTLGNHTEAKLINLYGPTEATVDVTFYDCPSDDEIEKIPIGKPIDNTKIFIFKDSELADVGESGELCISGAGLARGYLNNPALTAEKFVNNPILTEEKMYRSGDMARWLDDGNIEYLGREDQQVKIRGLRIELGEIESTIRDYRHIKDCAVIVKKYSENVILIIAYLVVKEEIETMDLLNHLKKTLPDYMIPNHFQVIGRLPLTGNGKVDRKALPEPELFANKAVAQG